MKKIDKTTSQAFTNMRKKIRAKMKEQGITYKDIVKDIEKDTGRKM